MNWQLFLSIYFLIFLAELPDKTAFATLLLATRSRALPVFAGVAAAFLVQTIVATVFGSVLSLLPERWIHLGAGVLFLGFAIQMWWQRNDSDDEESNGIPGCRVGFWPCAWRAFLVIFVAEWGDLTQIATASLIAKYHDAKVTVFVAAVLALWSVTALAIIVGSKAKKFIKDSLLKKICAVLFLGLGVYFLAT